MRRLHTGTAPSLLPIAAFLVAAASMGHYLIDDSYISFRYARNLAEGAGLVFNAGERVEGYTNFLWVVLMASAMRVGVEPDVAALALGGAFGLATIAVTRRLCMLFSDRGTPLLAATMLACATPFAFWCFSGMETAAFTAFATLGVHRLLRSTRASDLAASVAATALACLTRPDGAIFLAVTFGALLAAPEIRRGKRLALASAVAAAFLAPYLGWKWWYYGGVLPNTFYVRVGASAQQALRGLRYVGDFTIFAAAAGLVPAALFVLRAADCRRLYVAALVVAQVGYVVLVGGDSFLFYRFLVPILPLLCVLAALGLERAYDALAAGHGPARWTARAAVALFLAVSAGYGWQGPYRDATRDKAALNVRYRAIGVWLKEHSDPTDTIAVIANGIIPYYAERPTIDMLGLTDAHIAHRAIESLGSGMAGHEKGDGRYVFSRRPRYILVNPITTSAPATEELMALKSGRFLSTAELWRIADFHRAYRLRSVTIDGFWFNYFERVAASS